MDICKDFSELPPELRLAIWEHALQDEASSRLVLLHETSHRVLPFRYLASPLLSVNMEARRVALKFYDIKLPVWPALPANSVVVRSMRVLYLNHWRNHPVPESMEYWVDFGMEVEEVIDKSFKEGASNRGESSRSRNGGTVYLSSRHDRFVKSCDIWVDMGTICPGGRRTYDYRFLDICKAHILQDSSPDFTGLSVTRLGPQFHSPRTYLSDKIDPDVLHRLHIELALARPALGVQRPPSMLNTSRRSSVPHEPRKQGLEFVKAPLSHVEGISKFFQELALNGRGDYTILTWAIDQDRANGSFLAQRD